MNWEAISTLAEVVAALGVILTLGYLAYQVRENTTALSAQSRHVLSEFVLQIAQFRTEHADRFARLETEDELSPGDREFLYWGHMQFMLHAETYFHHIETGMMPQSHWAGYVRYLTGYIKTRDFQAFWDHAGPGFSRNFREWLNSLMVREGMNAASSPSAGATADG
jgi:hypothetical protein